MCWCKETWSWYEESESTSLGWLGGGLEVTRQEGARGSVGLAQTRPSDIVLYSSLSCSLSLPLRMLSNPCTPESRPPSPWDGGRLFLSRRWRGGGVGGHATAHTARCLALAPARRASAGIARVAAASSVSSVTARLHPGILNAVIYAWARGGGGGGGDVSSIAAKHGLHFSLVA